MSKLYDLTGEYLQLQEMVADDDIPAEAIADTLDAISGEISQKAEKILHVVANTDSHIDAISAEIDRLSARRKVLQNSKERIKDYLRSNMEACGIKKIECDLFTITCVKGRATAIIDDEDLLPDDMVKVVTKISPDKAAITAALKEGKDVPGAHLEETKSAIRIK